MQLIPSALVAVLGVGMAVPLLKQGPQMSIKDLLTQTSMPTTLKISELTSEYKCFKFKVSGDTGLMGGLGPFALFGMMGSTGGNQNAGLQLMGLMDASWAKADTVKVGGNEFLVTYRPEITAASTGGKASYVLRLNLVRTDMISSVEPLPDVTREQLQAAFASVGMVEQVASAQPNGTVTPVAQVADASMGENNAKQVALAMLMYTNDYDDITPYAQSTATVRNVTYPYCKTKDIWQTHNPNNSEFLFNMSVAGVNVADVEKPSETPMFYESKAWPDGTRIVAFMDGHVRIMPQEAWHATEPYLQLKVKKSAKPLPAGYMVDGIG